MYRTINPSAPNLAKWTLLGLLVSHPAISDQLPGIKEFADGNPALSAEVNANNLVLSDKTQELAARIKLLEDTSTRLIRDEAVARYSRSTASQTAAQEANTSGLGLGLRELEGGKLILDNVDCTNDPLALNKAYIEYSRFKDITFVIRGDCYGDYWLIDGNNPEAGVRQEFGQSVNITGWIGDDPQNPLSRPRLIPNPITNNLSLSGSFGGGLYLSNLIIVGGNQLDVILFSRGATGSVGNVDIQCARTDGQLSVGARVQNGAVPYFTGNVTVSGCDIGMWVFNNSTVSLYGSLSLQAKEVGLWVTQNSSVNTVLFRNAVIDINSDNTAMSIDNSTIELGWNSSPNYAVMIVDGHLNFDASRVELHVPVRWDSASNITLSNSNVDWFPLISDGDPTLDSNYLDSAGLTGRATCKGKSTLNTKNRITAQEITIDGCWTDSQWTSLFSSSP